MVRRCWVLGCKERKPPFTLIPRNPAMQRDWLKLMGNPDLLTMNIDILCQKVCVCKIHFTQYDYFRRQLRERVIILPSLFLPQPIEVPDSHNIDDATPSKQSNLIVKPSYPDTVFGEIPYLKNTIVDKTHTYLEVFEAEQLEGTAYKGKKTVHYFDCRKFLQSEQFVKMARKLTDDQINYLSNLPLIRKNKMTKSFTESEIITALSIFKQNIRLYKFLSNIFILPSLRSLERLLFRTPITAGINTNILIKLISQMYQNEDPHSKLYILTWQKTNLKTHLKFNVEIDTIEGFEDFGCLRTPNVSDSALVFMIRSVCYNIKQPIAYYFYDSSKEVDNLVRCIKEVYTALISSGLSVIAIVCDQKKANIEAAKMLRSTSKTFHYYSRADNHNIEIIPGKETVLIFDPGYLLIGLRNRLLKDDLEFEVEGEQAKKISCWDHIRITYEIDAQSIRAVDRFMPNITECHIYQNKIKKKNLASCTDIFHKDVGRFLNACMQRKIISQNSETIPSEASHTRDMIYFFSDLYDSVKNNEVDVENVMNNLKKGTHFWIAAINKLKSMRFVTRETEVPTSEDFLMDSWIKTLTGFQKLIKILWNSGVKSFNIGNISLDPTENFIDAIRSHNYKNESPTTSQFSQSFKTLLINNLSSKRYEHSNRKDDNAVVLLDDIYTLAFESMNIKSVNTSYKKPHTNHKSVVINKKWSQRPSRVFSAVYVVRKLCENRACEVCWESCTTTQRPLHKRSTKLLYKKRTLSHGLTYFYLNDSVVQAYTEVGNLIDNFLTSMAYMSSVSKIIKQIILNNSDIFSWFKCIDHHEEMFNVFADIMVNGHINRICTVSNKILDGKIYYKGKKRFYNKVQAKFKDIMK